MTANPHLFSINSGDPRGRPTRGGRYYAQQANLGGVVLIAAGLAFAGTARAGISDQPPAGYKSIWVVPGVVSNLYQGTGFVCVAHTASTIGVEVFSNAGGPAADSVTGLTLAAGESATVLTQALPGLSSYTDLSIPISGQGSARILGLAGSKVSCSAFVSWTDGSAQYALPVVKAKGQKGR